MVSGGGRGCGGSLVCIISYIFTYSLLQVLKKAQERRNGIGAMSSYLLSVSSFVVFVYLFIYLAFIIFLMGRRAPSPTITLHLPRPIMMWMKKVAHESFVRV